MKATPVSSGLSLAQSATKVSATEPLGPLAELFKSLVVANTWWSYCSHQCNSRSNFMWFNKFIVIGIKSMHICQISWKNGRIWENYQTHIFGPSVSKSNPRKTLMFSSISRFSWDQYWFGHRGTMKTIQELLQKGSPLSIICICILSGSFDLVVCVKTGNQSEWKSWKQL